MSAPHAADATAVGVAEAAPRPRIASIDVIRGAVMVLMAVDHVRVYAGVPAGRPDPAVFLTRWVTHFCAPVFLFLAGTSVYLKRSRGEDVSRYLLTRGAWLIVLELTVVRLSWTFNLEYLRAGLGGVLWVIGWCMIIMAALVKLRTKTVAALGVGLVLAHNAVMPTLIGMLPPSLGWLAKISYVGFFAGPIGSADFSLIVLYSVVPWIGVMAAGYGFGWITTLDASRRDRLCYAIGIGATVLFVVLRATGVYGDPVSWAAQREGNQFAPPLPSLLGFLNTRKYPASLLFLLMTLGPAIAVMPLLEHAKGTVAGWMTVFGRVPFFFYLLHIPLIHALALGVSAVREGAVNPWLFANHPMGPPPPPDGYAWSLPLLYGVWAVAVVALYVPCRWFSGLKAHRRDWWLSYL